VKKINVAVFGLGDMGATHVKAAQDSPCVASIIGYEPDKERAGQRGKELGIKATDDLESILGDPEIKFVSIAAVNEAHCDLTVRSLRAGKAVMCEKPMGITLEEAGRILAAERESGGFLQIGFELRYSRLYRKVKEWIDEGLVGRVLNTHCTYFCSEFHLRDSWRSRSKGTLLGEKLSHYLDLQRWWINDEVSEIFSLNAPNFVTYFNHPDNHQISYKFKDGAVSSLIFVMGIAETDEGDPLRELLEKQSDDGHALRYLIYGSRGAIETDVFRRRIRRWRFTDGPKQLESKIVETITFSREEDSEWIHNTYGQNKAIARLVAEGKPPRNPASDSYETMRLCFAAEISEREGRIVKLSELK